MRKIILSLITFYQRRISPHKGYSCAYGVLHKNGTCSSRVYSIIQNSPRANLISEISTQFKACKEAHFKLSSEKDKDEENGNNGCWLITGECGFWACFAAFS